MFLLFLFFLNVFLFLFFLAFVSEFHCFLRSRCSMEMWDDRVCPHETSDANSVTETNCVHHLCDELTLSSSLPQAS